MICTCTCGYGIYIVINGNVNFCQFPDYSTTEYRQQGEGRPGKYTCNVCHIGFENPGQYTHHMRRQHHSKGRLRFQCDICLQGFMNRAHFTAHMNRHSNKRPYVCATCGKAFFSKSNARFHEKGHLLKWSLIYSCVSFICMCSTMVVHEGERLLSWYRPIWIYTCIGKMLVKCSWTDIYTV